MPRHRDPHLERSTVEHALREAGGNIGTAARQLGASRRTLQNRMREFGMPRGKAGRRKQPLPYRRGARTLAWLGGAAALLVGGVLVAKKVT